MEFENISWQNGEQIKISRILVIGNGFDLAHGLKTGYNHFIKNLNKKKENNRWENYLINNYNMDKLWCDIEKIISEVLEDFSALLDGVNEKYYYLDPCEWYSHFIKRDHKKSSILNNLVNNRLANITGAPMCVDSVTNIRNDLVDLLQDYQVLINDLIRYLEAECSVHIKNLKSIDEQLFDKFDKVVTFNYTNIYDTLYNSNKEKEICYIHGNIDSKNIVLGIDDDLYNKKINDKFISYFKFYQKIRNKTGNTYKSWFKSSMTKIELSIFGHSLDTSDREILREMILAERTSNVTIYYHNEESLDGLIANLVKLIGKDKVIEDVYGFNPRITFEHWIPVG